MAVRFQLRRDTAANWTNPILALGEPGVETDTVKVGDGATAWNSLGYSITKECQLIKIKPRTSGTRTRPSFTIIYYKGYAPLY